jgi:hypothetical protein
MTLAQMHQQTTATLRILDQVQWLTLVPDRLAEHIKAKRMLHAADTIASSCALLAPSGPLAEINAVASLRRVLVAENNVCIISQMMMMMLLRMRNLADWSWGTCG